MELTGDLVITFGKYYGKTYKEICTIDKGYSFWLSKNWEDLQKNIKVVKPKKLEEVFEENKQDKTELGLKYLCYECCAFVHIRNSRNVCPSCSNYRKDIIPRLIQLRQRKLERNNQIKF